MSEQPTAAEMSTRSETLFEFSKAIADGADTINKFAARGSVAGLIAFMLQMAANDAAQQATKLRAAERAPVEYSHCDRGICALNLGHDGPCRT